MGHYIKARDCDALGQADDLRRYLLGRNSHHKSALPLSARR